MLQLSFIEKNKEEVLKSLVKRKFKKTYLIEQILDLGQKKNKVQFEKDNLLTHLNKCSAQVAFFLKSSKKKEAEEIKKESLHLKSKIKELETEFKDLEEKIREAIIELPNILDPLVKEGGNAIDNEIIYSHEGISLSDNKKSEKLPHWELAKKFEIIDFDLGAKISGSGFPVYKGKGARLQRSLIEYFLNENLQKGYMELSIPFLVKENSVFTTGQFPDKEGQMYHIEKDNLYLIPTSEVSLINCFANRIFLEKDLPIKATSYSPCFRREAGSYGMEVRGLNRLHQFDKVEIIQITTQENSHKALEEMVEHIKKLLLSLGLPFRILRLCSGDIGFTSSITYDFEVYSLAQKKWLEVSSVSNCRDFQSHRLKLRYKDKDPNNKKTKLAHTLNGSALALPRIIATLLEFYQKDNYIEIPSLLVPYTKFSKIE